MEAAPAKTVFTQQVSLSPKRSRNTFFPLSAKEAEAPNTRKKDGAVTFINLQNKKVKDSIDNEIDRLRFVYKKANERKGVLDREVSEERTKEHSLGAICLKLKMSKELFKQTPLTYDYKGRLLPSLAKSVKAIPLDSHEPKFDIKNTSVENLLSAEANHRKARRMGEVSKVKKCLEGVMADIKIKPVSGVTYLRNKKISKELPVANEAQIVIKNTIGKNNRSVLLPELNSEFLKADNSTEAISRNESDFLPLLCSESGVASASDLKCVRAKSNCRNVYKNHFVRVCGKDVNLLEAVKGRNCPVLPPHKINKKLRRYMVKGEKDLGVVGKTRKLPPPPLGLSFGHGIFSDQ